MMTVNNIDVGILPEKQQELTRMGTESHVSSHPVSIHATYGYWGLISTVILFQIINKIVTAQGPPKTVTADLWKWKNLYISWIHALIVSLWDMSCFYLYGAEMAEDLIRHVNLFTYSCITFSTGYFIYDFLDIVFSGKGRELWEVVIHHIAVAGMFFWNVVTVNCIAYNCIALMAEVNSLFLHSRKLLQMQGISYHHWFYRFICYINLLTFVIGRFAPVVYIYYGIFTQYDQVAMIYVIMLASSVFIMSVINVILFTRLIKSDIIRTFARRPMSKMSNATKSDKLLNGDANHVVSNNNYDNVKGSLPKAKQF